FQRLSQRLEYVTVELRQLIEEQHSVMGEAYFSGPRVDATAHQGYGGCGVVGRPEGPASEAGHVEAGGARRGDGGAVQRFACRERRQQAWQALRQHALAAAGRTHHEEAVSTSCGDEQRTLCMNLSPDIADIGLSAAALFPCRNPVRREAGAQRLFAGDVLADFLQV